MNLRLNTNLLDWSILNKEDEATIRQYAGREFDSLTMTPADRAEFDRMQAWVNELCQFGKNIGPYYTDIRRSDKLINEIRNLGEKMPQSSEFIRLQEENRKLKEDCAYWIARTKVLASMLERGAAPEGAKMEQRIHAEFLTKMMKEEMLIRVRNNEQDRAVINDPAVRWNVPKDVFFVIQMTYAEVRNFPDVLARPLDPEGGEPYWQIYVKMIAGKSEKDRRWVENRIARHSEILMEKQERSEIQKSLTERMKYYLESVYYDLDASSQAMIEKALPTLQDTLSKVNWMRIQEGSGSLIEPFLAKNLGLNLKMIDNEYARANATAWNAAAELYLKKCDQVARGEMRRIWEDLDAGFRMSAPVSVSEPESFDFSHTNPGMT
ncbi:MAG: hypothetical protein ACYDBP_03160 [Leptospirales bacterium]